MGPYLSQANTTKHSINGENAAMKFGGSEMQGWRNAQEDAHISELNLPNGEAVFGVFDGHGGAEVSKYVEIHFVKTLVSL